MTESVELYLPAAGLKWINANDRLVWMERSRRSRGWRQLARWRAASEGIGSFERIHVVGMLHFADNRLRDPANWAPTAKACIDGLVDAGVVVDDNHKYVTGPDMRIGAKTIGALVGLRLVITPLEVES